MKVWKCRCAMVLASGACVGGWVSEGAVPEAPPPPKALPPGALAKSSSATRKGPITCT